MPSCQGPDLLEPARKELELKPVIKNSARKLWEEPAAPAKKGGAPPGQG